MSTKIADHVVVSVCVSALLIVASALRRGNLFLLTMLILFAFLGACLGAHSWNQLVQPRLGSFHGAAKVVEDPQWRNGGVQTVLQLEGERFIVYAYGLPGRRLSNRRVGEVMQVSGDRLRLEASKQHRLSYRHIVGTFAVRDVSESFGNGSVL